MVRLVLKIFLAYWIAASAVILIVDFEPHRQIHHSEISDALDSALAMNGRLIVATYESGHCPEVEQVLIAKSDTLTMATADGHFLCGDPGILGEQSLVAATARTSKRMTTNHSTFQVIALPIVSQTGRKYVVLLKSNYSSAIQAYGLLPGYTTIAISCVVTLVLAFLVALPIRKLREAARQIAMGNLDARVGGTRLTDRLYGANGRDDIAKLVRDFNHMAERLQALAESQRMLLRDVSHELRSPLARLAVGLGLARHEAPQSMRVHLDRIESETQRLNELIGQLLALSQLETLQQVETPHSVSLSELVIDLLPDIQYEASHSDCVITTTVVPGCNVRGDSELLRAAVENILRNAIRYVPDNGRIHVETAEVYKEGCGKSMIRISDNGPGIPESELKTVLEPFYRADKARNWQKTGFGIGLAIAKRAAVVHGGTIDIRNRAEGGLSVEMMFPFERETA